MFYTAAAIVGTIPASDDQKRAATASKASKGLTAEVVHPDIDPGTAAGRGGGGGSRRSNAGSSGAGGGRKRKSGGGASAADAIDLDSDNDDYDGESARGS